MDNETKFTNLVLWIKNNNGYINEKLSIKDRQIYANDLINKDEILFKFNQNLSICGDTAIDTIDKLIYEKKLGENSFYFNYINILPTFDDIVSHPILQNINDICPTITNDIIKHKDNLKLLFNRLNHDIKDIVWGYIIFITRNWSNKFVPLADMFDHKINSSIFLHNNDFLSMTVNNDINKDDIIYDSYGFKSVNDLYIIYGFISDDDIRCINIKYDDKDFLLLNTGIQENLYNYIRSKHNEYETLLILSQITNEEFNKYHKSIDRARELLLSENIYDKNIARIIMLNIDIINNTFKKIIVKWNELLHPPIKYMIDFNT